MLTLNFEWIDKQDGFEDVLAEDINKLAHGIINSANKIGLLSQEKADKKEIKADAIPTENSTNLITSGGVYDALKDTTKDLVVTGRTLLPVSGDFRFKNISSFSHKRNEIISSFEEGKNVTAKIEVTNLLGSTRSVVTLPLTDIHSISGNKEIYFAQSLFDVHTETSFLMEVVMANDTGATFFCTKLANNEYVDAIAKNATETFTSFEEQLSDKPTRLAVEEMIDTAIGDIETSLENIIAKYGLGGEAS